MKCIILNDVNIVKHVISYISISIVRVNLPVDVVIGVVSVKRRMIKIKNKNISNYTKLEMLAIKACMGYNKKFSAKNNSTEDGINHMFRPTLMPF